MSLAKLIVALADSCDLRSRRKSAAAGPGSPDAGDRVQLLVGHLLHLIVGWPSSSL
jgi:hypothetical protein